MNYNNNGTFQVAGGSGQGVLYFNPVSGNVGIGTASPGTKLDVAGSATIASGDSSGRLLLGRFSATYPWSLLQLGTGSDSFRLRSTSDAELFYVSNTGNVGIGITSPQNQLNIVGTGYKNVNITGTGTTGGGITLQSANTGGRAFTILSTGTGASPGAGFFGIVDESASAYEMIINGSTGNVGIGTVNPQNKLNVVGDINATGNLYGKYVTTQAAAAPWIGTPTGSRALNTVYQNTGGKAIMVSVIVHGAAAVNTEYDLEARTDSAATPTTPVSRQGCWQCNTPVHVFFVVLPGNYYKVVALSGAMTLDAWTEWS